MPWAPLSTKGTFFAVSASRIRSRSIITSAIWDHISRYCVDREAHSRTASAWLRLRRLAFIASHSGMPGSHLSARGAGAGPFLRGTGLLVWPERGVVRARERDFMAWFSRVGGVLDCTGLELRVHAARSFDLE